MATTAAAAEVAVAAEAAEVAAAEAAEVAAAAEAEEVAAAAEATESLFTSISRDDDVNATIEEILHIHSHKRAASILISSLNDVPELLNPLHHLQLYHAAKTNDTNFDITGDIRKIRQKNNISAEDYKKSIKKISELCASLMECISMPVELESKTKRVINIALWTVFAVGSAAAIILGAGVVAAGGITAEAVAASSGGIAAAAAAEVTAAEAAFIAACAATGLSLTSGVLLILLRYLEQYKKNICILLLWFPDTNKSEFTNLRVHQLENLLFNKILKLDNSNKNIENIDYYHAIEMIERVCIPNPFKFTDSSLKIFTMELKAHISMLYLSRYFINNKMVGVVGTQNSGKSTFVVNILDHHHIVSTSVVVGTNTHTVKLASFHIPIPKTTKSMTLFDIPGGDGVTTSEILNYLPQFDAIILMFDVNSGITEGSMDCIKSIENMQPKKILIFLHKADMLCSAKEFSRNDVAKATQFFIDTKQKRFNQILEFSRERFPKSEIPNLLKLENTYLTCLNQDEYNYRKLSQYIDNNGSIIVLSSAQIITKICGNGQ